MSEADKLHAWIENARKTQGLIDIKPYLFRHRFKSHEEFCGALNQAISDDAAGRCIPFVDR